LRYGFIAAEKATYPVRVLCRVLRVSRSGFYTWCRRPEAARRRRDRELVELVVRVFKESRRTYGSPRVHREFQSLQVLCGRRRIERLMRERGITPPRRRRFRTTTDSKHRYAVAANVLGRNFKAESPNRSWATDITYVWTREGWLYLAVVIDLFSRRVVGWAMGNDLGRALALRALGMALDGRDPARTLVHHSDRGSQYACDDYQRILRQRGIVCSMSRKGDCWDNAVVESFFGTLKTELVHRCEFATRDEARLAIFDYIEVFYNRQRRHSYLGYRSPEEFERTMEVAA